MADVHTKEQRSKNMTAIKSRGNKSTEIAFINILKRAGIKGWRRHYIMLPGTPDFIFLKSRIVIFVDGCFWHGCKKCTLKPSSNRGFWEEKIDKNKKRDRKLGRKLRQKDWVVIRFWEHQIAKTPQHIIRTLRKQMPQY